MIHSLLESFFVWSFSRSEVRPSTFQQILYDDDERAQANLGNSCTDYFSSIMGTRGSSTTKFDHGVRTLHSVKHTCCWKVKLTCSDLGFRLSSQFHSQSSLI